MLKRLVSTLLLTALLVAAVRAPRRICRRRSRIASPPASTRSRRGNLDAAEAAFRDVLKAGGERAFVHHNLGIILQQRGRNADALAEFRAASRLDPSFGPARLLAGTSLLTLGRPERGHCGIEAGRPPDAR